MTDVVYCVIARARLTELDEFPDNDPLEWYVRIKPDGIVDLVNSVRNATLFDVMLNATKFFELVVKLKPTDQYYSINFTYSYRLAEYSETRVVIGTEDMIPINAERRLDTEL